MPDKDALAELELKMGQAIRAQTAANELAKTASSKTARQDVVDAFSAAWLAWGEVAEAARKMKQEDWELRTEAGLRLLPNWIQAQAKRRRRKNRSLSLSAPGGSLDPSVPGENLSPNPSYLFC